MSHLLHSALQRCVPFQCACYELEGGCSWTVKRQKWGKLNESQDEIKPINKVKKCKHCPHWVLFRLNSFYSDSYLYYLKLLRQQRVLNLFHLLLLTVFKPWRQRYDNITKVTLQKDVGTTKRVCSHWTLDVGQMCRSCWAHRSRNNSWHLYKVQTRSTVWTSNHDPTWRSIWCSTLELWTGSVLRATCGRLWQVQGIYKINQCNVLRLQILKWLLSIWYI